MKELFEIVKAIAAFHSKSNPEANRIIEEKLAKGESFDVKFLFDLYNLDINATNVRANTALHGAAYKNHTDLAKILIDAGINVNLRNVLGETALYVAVNEGHINMALALIDAKADFNIPQSNGFTVLHIAASHGDIDIITKLIALGADVNVQDKPIRLTPLHLASKNGHSNIIKALINAGANITILNEERKTALDCAIDDNKCTSAAILLKHSAPEIQKNFKNTCIANKHKNIIYTITTSDTDRDYVGAYKILEVLFKTPEEQINFLGQVDISPDHEFISLLLLADKYKVSPTVIYSCFDKFKDIEKTEKVISKEVKLTRLMGEVSYREVASLAKILLTAQSPHIPKEVLANIASHDITYDQKFADSIKKSREKQPVQGNSL